MSDCFISYKREDQARVLAIVRALRGAGLAVWWDQDIPAGEHWRERITEHLDGARCVLVCWTAASTGPAGSFVREEAGRAKGRGVLLQVKLDPAVQPPLGFGEQQVLDLGGWKGDEDDPRWQHCLASVRARLAGAEGPQPPLPPPPRPWVRVAAAAALVTAVVVPGVGFVNDVLGLSDALCRQNSTQSLIQSLCRGLGKQPSAEEEEAWRKASTATGPEACNALKEYVRRYPEGAHGQTAQARINAPRTTLELSWQARSVTLPHFSPPPLKPSASASAARETQRAEVLAAAASTTCGAYASTDTHRLRDTRLDESAWKCEYKDDGWRCHYDGMVWCDLDVRSTQPQEDCGPGA